MTPIRRARSDGIGALPSGIGQGLIGVITKPVGGALEFVNKASVGLLSQAGMKQPAKRIRTPKRMTGRIPLICFQISLEASSHQMGKCLQWFPVTSLSQESTVPVAVMARDSSMTAIFSENATLIAVFSNSKTVLEEGALRCNFDTTTIILRPLRPFLFLW
jgi:hypothetical protein